MNLRSPIPGGRAARGVAAAGLVTGLATVAAVALPGAASADEEFADASSATVGPGTMMFNPDGQCTSNFIFTSGDTVLIGQAAHCTGTGAASDTDGCTAESMGLGTKIDIEGAEHPGTLVYNSWLAMQENDEDDPELCQFNDFALVEIHPDDVDRVNPTVPVFGGPTGLDTDGTEAGEQVYTYQNSELRGGISALSPKQGFSLGDSGDGRTHEVVTPLTPGVPGDSGSGYLDSDGEAFGLLSTLNLAPAPGTNGVTDLAMALEYANAHSDLDDITLETGTEEFSAPLLPGLG